MSVSVTSALPIMASLQLQSALRQAIVDKKISSKQSFLFVAEDCSSMYPFNTRER